MLILGIILMETGSGMYVSSKVGAGLRAILAPTIESSE